MEHFSWISFWAKQWKNCQSQQLACTTWIGCMTSILCRHIFKKLSLEKVYISSSHHLFITSTFTLQHLAPWRANARPKREAPRTPRLRAVWRLQCAPQAWINQMVFCHRFVTFESWMMLDVCHHEMVWWVWWYSACHGALVTRFVQDLPSLESDSAGDWGFQGESRLWK